MHPSAQEHMALSIETYMPKGRRYRVVDFGSRISQSQIATHRELLKDHDYDYIGVDIEAGPNVDVVMKKPYRVPLKSNSADVILSGQTFEHIPFFWASLAEVARVLRPEGYMFLTVPSRGNVYDVYDCWRYYPDGLRAMAAWARLELVEASTDFPPAGARRRHEYHRIETPDYYWGDTVGVFRKPARYPRLTMAVVRRATTWWANRTRDLGGALQPAVPPARRKIMGNWDRDSHERSQRARGREGRPGKGGRRRRWARRTRRLPRRLRKSLWRANAVRERARFAERDFRRAPGVHRYRLRGVEARVLVRHGVTSSTFTEVFCHRDYELPKEIADLLSRREASIVDLGGHAGYVSALLVARFPRAQVVAYEPDPRNGGLHAEAIALSGAAKRWRLVRAVASNRSGRAPFAAMGGSHSRVVAEGSGEATMAIEQHDVLPVLQGADFAKIDIEGGEWAILGDERFGHGGPRSLALEHHSHLCPAPDPGAEALRLLEAAGYRIVNHPRTPGRHPPGQGMLWAIKDAY